MNMIFLENVILRKIHCESFKIFSLVAGGHCKKKKVIHLTHSLSPCNQLLSKNMFDVVKCSYKIIVQTDQFP